MPNCADMIIFGGGMSMATKLAKMIVFVIMMISLIAFILCNKLIIMIVSGATLWLSILIGSEVIIDKKNASKFELNEITVYLINNKTPSSKFCRTMGTINPIIVFDSKLFYALSDETKMALVFHELYHVIKKHNLKRFLLFGLVISLYILSRQIMTTESDFKYICFAVLLVSILFFIIYCRKNEYNADLFSVKKSKNSKYLVDWFIIQAKNEQAYTLSIHPSFRSRIRNIKLHYKQGKENAE